MPTILVGSPISVVSHSVRMSFFISSILSAESANSRRLSTQMVTIAILSVLEHVYMHGSLHVGVYTHACAFWYQILYSILGRTALVHIGFLLDGIPFHCRLQNQLVGAYTGSLLESHLGKHL